MAPESIILTSRVNIATSRSGSANGSSCPTSNPWHSARASVTRMTNVMSVAGSFALLSFPKEALIDAIRKQFKSKPRVAETNVAAVDATYDYVARNFHGSFGYKLGPAERNSKRILIRGSSVIGIGKIAAGCRLQTYYPITPASDESE